MTRGYVWAIYFDDDGSPWAMQVDADEAQDENRGWTIAEAGLIPFPRSWTPRKVVGIDETGQNQSARIASLDAALWSGAAGTFTVEATDRTLQVATVIARHGERRRGPR